MHFYYLQGIEKTKFFYLHYRRNDKTGKMLKILIHLLQLEHGKNKPFCQSNFEMNKHTLTSTRLKHSWKFWWVCRIKVEECLLWKYECPQFNYIYIMELLSFANLNHCTLSQLNTCWIALEVLTVADITTLKRTRLILNIKKGINH